MRALILIALLAIGANEARLQYHNQTRPASLPDRTQAAACFYQDTGVEDCLVELYGRDRINKCLWYLEWDNVSKGVGRAFISCVASVRPSEPSVWGHTASTYRDK